MSSNQNSQTNQQCHNCTHKNPTLQNGTFFCRLHDEQYLKDPIHCEDWEEKSIQEEDTYSCD